MAHRLAVRHGRKLRQARLVSSAVDSRQRCRRKEESIKGTIVEFFGEIYILFSQAILRFVNCEFVSRSFIGL